MTTPVKPTYLKLLNGISNAEWSAHIEFTAWMKATSDESLRPLLRLVTAREGEHALSLEKRIIALGFSLVPRIRPMHEENMRVLSDPAVSDMAKFERIGFGDGGEFADQDPFGTIFNDRTIDIETGALLGRYIAEERDTTRRMRAAYKALQEQSQTVAA